MLMRAFRYAILFAAVAIVPVQTQAQTKDIIAFADSSLIPVLGDANNFFLYENAMTVRVTYGDSATLAKQIENGATADVFISADQASMDELQTQKLIDTDTRANRLSNKLVIIAAADSKLSLTMGQNFPLAQALGNGHLAMADPAATTGGKYGKAALEALGVWASVAGKIAPAPDSQLALSAVSKGEAPLGIVYQTDAAADKTVKVIATFPQTAHPPIVYPLALLTKSSNVLGQIYVQWLTSAKPEPYFEDKGFALLH